MVCGNEIEQGLHGRLGRGTHQLRLRIRWGGETLLGEIGHNVEVRVVIYDPLRESTTHLEGSCEVFWVSAPSKYHNYRGRCL